MCYNERACIKSMMMQALFIRAPDGGTVSHLSNSEGTNLFWHFFPSPDKLAACQLGATAKVAGGFRWEWRAFGSPATRQVLLNRYPTPIRLTMPNSLPERRRPPSHTETEAT